MKDFFLCRLLFGCVILMLFILIWKLVIDVKLIFLIFFFGFEWIYVVLEKGIVEGDLIV